MFHFYLNERCTLGGWETLVHVCGRWRNVVFASPRYLNLQIICTERTPVMTMADVWPALPMQIWNNLDPTCLPCSVGTDNIVAALKYHDRVSHVDLQGLPNRTLESLAAEMDGPFPELTYLHLRSSSNAWATVLPDSFLGGSAPRLKSLYLNTVSFPPRAMQKLLLSAADSLTHLSLWNVPPDSGYISPGSVVASLSSLAALEHFCLGFHSARPHPDEGGRQPPPPTRTVLRALTYFRFQGANEYLEDLVTRFDSPLLHTAEITFFDQVFFDASQLSQFVDRTETFKRLDKGKIILHMRSVELVLGRRTSAGDCTSLTVGVASGESAHQLSCLAQVCGFFGPALSVLERFSIHKEPSQRSHWQPVLENTFWLEVLHTLTGVQSLYITENLGLYVVSALQELTGEGVAEVLPALRKISLGWLQTSTPVYKELKQLIAKRQLSGHPVSIYRWEMGEKKGP